jgi:hypothetical protein
VPGAENVVDVEVSSIFVERGEKGGDVFQPLTFFLEALVEKRASIRNFESVGLTGISSKVSG